MVIRDSIKAIEELIPRRVIVKNQTIAKKLAPDISARVSGYVRTPTVKVLRSWPSSTGFMSRKLIILNITNPAIILYSELLKVMMSVSWTMLAKQELYEE